MNIGDTGACCAVTGAASRLKTRRPAVREVGVIALAGPEDLRAAPDTAGTPMPGTEIRILGENRREDRRSRPGSDPNARRGERDEQVGSSTAAVDRDHWCSRRR